MVEKLLTTTPIQIRYTNTNMAFSALHTGLEALVNALLITTPCSEVNIVLNPGYEVVENKLVSPEWRVECAKPVQGLEITFSPPTEREDGSALDSSEIGSYIIRVDGHTASAKTCDTDGQCSTTSATASAVE